MDSRHSAHHIIYIDAPKIEVLISSQSQQDFGNLYVLFCSHSTSEINFRYSSIFHWYHNGVLLSSKSQILILPSLSLNDVGNYSCNVKATSTFLGKPLHGRSAAHEIVLKGKREKLVYIFIENSFY